MKDFLWTTKVHLLVFGGFVLQGGRGRSRKNYRSYRHLLQNRLWRLWKKQKN